LAANRPLFRTQFAAIFIGAVCVLLAIYIVYGFEQGLINYFTVQMNAGASGATILRATKVVLWAVLAFILIRTINLIIFSLAYRARNGVEAPSLVRNIFSIVAFVALFGLIFTHFYPDVNLGALFTTSAIFGVIIGLALQDTLGNLFAGISVQADKPFQVGDVITVAQGRTGVVESISWRAVKIRTFSNHVLLMSNSTIAKEAIEVCPRENLNARLVFFNTLYTDSPAKTIHIVREAVRSATNVSQKITPVVRVRNLGDNGIDWEVKYWPEDYAKHNDTDALVRQLIWYAFKRAGINFAFPTRTVMVERKSRKDGAAPDSRGVVTRLSDVDIFAPLSLEETERLARGAISRIFAPGEFVIRAGDDGSSMFVVNQGSVKVQINDNGTRRTVAVLREGDFFGEMALFTGEPRTANVVAVEETEVIEIGHDAMKHLFETNPGLVESLSHIIAERRAGLAAQTVSEAETTQAAQGIISSIKRFFGMGH
jgi:small-conductance mechanosensitive channel